jgi:hypothetical protein
VLGKDGIFLVESGCSATRQLAARVEGSVFRDDPIHRASSVDGSWVCGSTSGVDVEVEVEEKGPFLYYR